MRVIRAHCIYFDVETISGQKFLVDIIAIFANLVAIGVEFRRHIADLPEKVLATPAIIERIVDVDVMILRVKGLFNKRFVDLDVIDVNMVISFFNSSASSVSSAFSNAKRISRRTRKASLIDLRPGACSAHSGWPK